MSPLESNAVAFTPAVGTTTYTVTGTDGGGCINTDQVIVTVNPLPSVNAGPDVSVCIGASATLSGSGAITYTWNNGVSNGVAFTPAATTTYTVTGTNANGCTNTDQVLVTVNPLPNVNAGTDQTICVGASVTLSGAGAVNYTWNNGVTNGVAFAPASTTTYTVTGTNANGCVNTDQVLVTVNPLPTVNAGPDVAVCVGQSVTLTGSGAATYSSVTLSAPGVLFASGAVTSLGSITVQTSAAGAFGGVVAYSNTSGDVTVTATAGSASKTLDLTFAAAGALTGTALTVNVADAAPGKTMTVSGALTDKYGNGVATNASKLKVTYTGPGFVVGSLPTATETDGSYEFKVLLGSNDTISGSVVVAYAGADDAFTTGTSSDDLSSSATLAPAAAAKKVNAGSFKGYVVVYARGYEGSRLSAKIGNDWVIVDPIVNNQENGTLFRVTDFTGAGVDIAVRIYIDRVLVATINLTTK